MRLPAHVYAYLLAGLILAFAIDKDVQCALR